MGNRKSRIKKKANTNTYTIYIFLYNRLTGKPPQQEAETPQQENSDELPYDIQKYEIKITPQSSLKEIKNQLVNNYNISLDELALYSKDKDLSEDSDDRLFNSIYATYEGQKLYLYNKNEFYEINIKYNHERYLLNIHDAMKIENIIKIFCQKYYIIYKYRVIYQLIADGISLYGDKEAAFYNLRSAKSIILKEHQPKG